MKSNTNLLDKYFQTNTKIAKERLKYHIENPNITYDDYREKQRQTIYDRIKSKRVIYLDTNAWKCLSDYERGKKNLNKGMVEFAETMNTEQVRNNFVFPIGPSTMFELQSMEDPASISTLSALVGRFSMDVGCQPPNELIAQELAFFNQKITRDADSEPGRFCHPMEMMGILNIPIPSTLPPPALLAFKKMFLDILYAVPTSAHIEIAASSPPIWDNMEGIEIMNEGMITHQHDIKTYPDALLLELCGILRNHVHDGPQIAGFPPAKSRALLAMSHWKENPHSRQLITARISASLHAIIRYIDNRKFRKGDIADFVAAQIALPCAHAFFTDRALVSLLSEPKVGLKQFCACEVISGFENFAAYLKIERI